MHRIPIEGELDLHAFAPRDIPSVVHEYLNEAAAAGLTQVRLIHGRGRGVQRGIVQATLDRHPRRKKLYFTMQRNALNPSRQPIFFPSA